MKANTGLIKVGRQGIQVRNLQVPASFFRHLQPGKRFVVLAEGNRWLMHIRTRDLEAVRRAYRAFVSAKKDA